MPEATPVVLVVEDDAALCEMLREVLEGEGYRVEVAANGGAGLARLAVGGVDLVLLDLRLPDIDGLEFCAAVRAGARQARVPILCLSGASAPDEVEAALTAGADAYLAKPFDFDDLLAEIRALVARGEQ